jgi:hypothetical protein
MRHIGGRATRAFMKSKTLIGDSKAQNSVMIKLIAHCEDVGNEPQKNSKVIANISALD